MPYCLKWMLAIWVINFVGLLLWLSFGFHSIVIIATFGSVWGFYWLSYRGLGEHAPVEEDMPYNADYTEYMAYKRFNR